MSDAAPLQRRVRRTGGVLRILLTSLRCRITVGGATEILDSVPSTAISTTWGKSSMFVLFLKYLQQEVTFNTEKNDRYFENNSPCCRRSTVNSYTYNYVHIRIRAHNCYSDFVIVTSAIN